MEVVLARNPAVVFDIAHNAEKAEHFVASLRERFPGRRVHYVVAIGESKDAREIMRTFAGVPATFTFTALRRGGAHRRRSRSDLARMADALGTSGRERCADPSKAFDGRASRWPGRTTSSS